MKISVLSSCASLAALSLTAFASADFTHEVAKFGGAYAIDFRSGAITEDKGGSGNKAATTVYDSTNYVTTGATGYGAGATSSTDLSAVYGDSLNMTGTGALDSFKFSVFVSGSSTGNLTNATETIRFYRASDSTYIGGFTTTLGNITKGYYSTYTVGGLSSLGITFDTANVIVTQQLSNVVGATRMGTVFGNNITAPAPAIGTTTPGLYMSNSSTPAGTYTFTGYTANSNGVYQVSTAAVPAPGAAVLIGVAGLITGRRRR